MGTRIKSLAWLALAALLGMVSGVLSGRAEVLGCADRMHGADPRGVRAACGLVWEMYE